VLAVLPFQLARASDCYLPCERLQHRVVHGDRIDYAAIHTDPDRSACIDRFQRSNPTDSREGQIAFWINAYNFLTLDLIASAGPIFSVRQDGRAIFSDARVNVDGVALTLDQIEHQKLTHLSGDPRVPLLLHCGTRDCAPLPSRPVCGETLEDQIRDTLRVFLRLPSSIAVDETNKTLRASHLLHPAWDGGPLISRFGSLLSFLAAYSPAIHDKGDLLKDYRIIYRPYDWRLDDWHVEYYLP